MGLKDINEEFDFWKDATDLAKELLVEDAEEQIIAHFEKRGFRENEKKLAKHFIESALGFSVTMASLKHSCKKK